MAKDKLETYADSFSSEEDINSTYDDLKKQNFTALRDKQIQLENAKANSYRNTQLQLAQMGLNSQGYGSSLSAGVYNNYLNAFSQAEDETNKSNDTLEAERRSMLNQYRQNKNANILANIQNSDPNNPDALGKYLQDMKYGTYENGEFTFGDKPANMSDDEWANLKYNYANITGGSSENAQRQANTFLNYDEFAQGQFINKNGKTETYGNAFSNEGRYLYTLAARGDFEYGDCFAVTNKWGETEYFQFTNKGFLRVSKDTYDNNENDNKYSVGAKAGGEVFSYKVQEKKE